MTELQWKQLLDVIEGKETNPLQTGFVIDSPWLPNWYGIKLLDYFTSDELWFKANLHAINSFPDVMFLPGFWSEFGMCTEPSAFGARCSFPSNEFPHAHKSISSVSDIAGLVKPNPETDGFASFMLNRLLINQKRIEDSGHRIYFSVSRGPLNIASFLMGTTEFLTAMITNPDEIHQLLTVINEYLIDLHDLHKQVFPTIDGIFILDDIIGFIGEEEFKVFGLPYFKALFDRDVSVRFLHNDASIKSSISYLPEMGVNLFNMGFDTDLNELKEQTGNQITMMGNIPPRDVLANGTQQDVGTAVKEMINNLKDRNRVLVSCGGGMPPDVSTENINSFTEAVRKFS
ncbi:MAG TPA: uroporphyrinogen decarboxylase [Bacteroides sp.]|nr:uroporphyrinogen decarboxylase [Bacteroides sp.]